jgi:flagellar biosynthesis/type III secretory pathway chaperone
MDGQIINEIMCKELMGLNKLLDLLDEQHDYLINDNMLALEEIVERIQGCNKEIAEYEVERRKTIKSESMKDVITELNDSELDKNYRLIRKVLHEIQVQKETNDMLIKLGLGYSTKMLKIINPGERSQTYNAYGKYKK